MDNQGIFNKVVAHARKQKAKARNDPNRCRYRAANGMQCFFGCLIPDSLYNEKLEGHSLRFGIIDEVRGDFFKPILEHIKAIGPDDIDFLYDLQRIHDQTGVEYWEEEFKSFAEKYHLDLLPNES